jgi:hypothetical protein
MSGPIPFKVSSPCNSKTPSRKNQGDQGEESNVADSSRVLGCTAHFPFVLDLRPKGEAAAVATAAATRGVVNCGP